MFSQTKSLELFRSLPGFHTEMIVSPQKFYVDFSTSEIIGALQIPRMQPFQPSTLKVLLENIFDDFTKIGVKSIETDEIHHQKIINEFAKDYGYVPIDHEELYLGKMKMQELLIFPLGDIPPSFNIISLKNNTHPTLIAKIINFLLKKENISQETLEKLFSYLSQQKEKIISHLVAINENEDIIGHGLMFKNRWDERIGILSMLHSEENTLNLQDWLIYRLVTEASYQQIEGIEVHIRDDVVDLEKIYQRYGFNFTKLVKFSRDN